MYLRSLQFCTSNNNLCYWRNCLYCRSLFAKQLNYTLRICICGAISKWEESKPWI